MARADRGIVSLALACFVSLSGCASPFHWNAEPLMSNTPVAGPEAPRLLEAPESPKILRVSGVQEEGEAPAGSTLQWDVEEPEPRAARKSVAFAEPAKPAPEPPAKAQSAAAPAPAPKPAVDDAAPLVRFVDINESPTQNCKSCGAAAPAAKLQATTTAKLQTTIAAKPQTSTSAKPQAIVTAKPQATAVRPQTSFVTPPPRPRVAPSVGSPGRMAPLPAPHTIAIRGLLRVSDEPHVGDPSENHALPGTRVERPAATRRVEHHVASPHRPQITRPGRRTLWETLQGIGASHPLASDRRTASQPDHPASHARTSHNGKGILSGILR